MLLHQAFWLSLWLTHFLVAATIRPDSSLRRRALRETYDNLTAIPYDRKPSVQTPIAAAWMFMSDDTDYSTIPDQWYDINFKLVDFLYLGPAGIQANGKFGLYSSNTTGSLAHRFRWIIQAARSQNPNIKIIASQWYSSTPNVWGYDLSKLNGTEAIDKYTDSVRDFVKGWLTTAGGIDGFDIDYESENIVRIAPTIFSQIRRKLDALSKNQGGRRFYVTVSPVVVAYLSQAASYLDYVNMQTYGSTMYTLDSQRFVNVGFEARQLLFGVCPETDCSSKTTKEVKQLYQQNNLTGIHLWRLNSDNFEHELKVQKQIYRFLHPDA